MIVITLTDCPPALRGDLTKWLQEINTGVYVGYVSARVRDELWQRVRKNIKSGRATMVFSANNEQRMDFRIHNSDWEPIDFDGLKLMLRPSSARIRTLRERRGFSNAAKSRQARRISAYRRSAMEFPACYAVVDVETTGLLDSEHELIEIAAIVVSDGKEERRFHALIKCEGTVPKAVEALTGISDQLLRQQGRELDKALPEFLTFLGELPIVSHNAEFDYRFLRAACRRCDLPLLSNQCIDTLALARRLVDDVQDYRLSTLAGYFGIETEKGHRSQDDCLMTKSLYEKLIEFQQG